MDQYNDELAGHRTRLRLLKRFLIYSFWGIVTGFSSKALLVFLFPHVLKGFSLIDIGVLLGLCVMYYIVGTILGPNSRRPFALLGLLALVLSYVSIIYALPIN